MEVINLEEGKEVEEEDFLFLHEVALGSLSLNITRISLLPSPHVLVFPTCMATFPPLVCFLLFWCEPTVFYLSYSKLFSIQIIPTLKVLFRLLLENKIHIFSKPVSCQISFLHAFSLFLLIIFMIFIIFNKHE